MSGFKLKLNILSYNDLITPSREMFRYS